MRGVTGEVVTMSNGEIDRLLSLAANRSKDARNELASAMVDFFMHPDERLSDQQRALMGDVLAKLLGEIEMDVRRNLADALVRSGIDLPDLIHALANDDISVAQPLLLDSPLIRDHALIEIVKNRTEEHRMTIAMRRNPSDEVTDALVERSGPDVIETLLRNQDATLSRRAMEFLVAESRRQDRFQEPLVARADLPADLAHRMYWWVSAALRRKILLSYKVDEEILDKSMERAALAASADLVDGQSAQARAQRLARRMAELGELTDNFLVTALRQQRITVFVAALAERAEISYKTAWQIVSDRGFESFLVLARAVDLTRDVLTSTVLLLAEARTAKAAQRPDIIHSILTMFDRLDRANCVRILRLWQRNADYQSAIESLERARAG